MEETKIFTSDDIILSLCDSVSSVLSSACSNTVNFTPMIQKITKTSLRPDIGTFVLFTGSFSGMVVLNFPKEAAMELYSSYMLTMGLGENDLAKNHTSDEVSDTLGELMNQIVGNFTNKISSTLHTVITQSQPKMLALPHQVQIDIGMTLDNPKYRRVTFKTSKNNVFYVEMAIDDTEFTAGREIEEHSQVSPDDILAQFQI